MRGINNNNLIYRVDGTLDSEILCASVGTKLHTLGDTEFGHVTSMNLSFLIYRMEIRIPEFFLRGAFFCSVKQ